MKHKLLLLGLFLMASVSMSAQSFTANRTKLVPGHTTWQPEVTCYLWNVGAQGFYTNHQGDTDHGPYWGTRAVACDTVGQQVIFSRTNPGAVEEDWEADGVLDNTYLLTSYVTKFSEFLCTFADGWNGIWTDNNSNNYRYFNIIVKGDVINIERNMFLAEGGETSEGKYIGVLATDIDKTLKLHDIDSYLDEAENTYYNIDPNAEFWEDWYVVSEEQYQAWVDAGGAEQAKLFVAAESLKKALEKAYADNPGINTLSEPLAVYNNENATIEELNAAEATIPALIVKWIKEQGSGSPDNPMDFTSSIINPTFDTVGDFTGWEGTTFGAGGNVYSNAEHYGKTFDTYQDISDLPGGVFMVSCNGYTRYQNETADYNAWKAGTPSETKIYLKSETNGMFSTPVKHVSEGGSIDYEVGTNGTVNVTFKDEEGYDHILYTPNFMTSANDYFNDPEVPNRYYNEAFGALADGETLRIGVINEKATSSDWSIFDDFKLFYLGDTEESYKFWGGKVADNNQISFEDVYYGAPEKTQYDTAISTLRNASSKEAVMTAVAGIEDIAEIVATSKANYANFMAKYQETLNWLEEHPDLGGDYIDLLSDYLTASADDYDPEAEYVVALPNGFVNCFLDLENNEKEGKLSAEEIEAETEFMLNLKILAIQNSLEDGSDLTDFIINPGFEDPLKNGKANGWNLDTHNGTTTSSLTNWRGGNATNYCAEAYQQKFDVYQELQQEVPNGLYEVSVQAYYRTGTNEDSYAAYLEDPELVGPAKVHTYVYFNDFSAPVKNSMEILYHENLANNCTLVGYDDNSQELYCLNGMASASQAFSMKDESMNFTQKVYGLVTDGKIRLGIRNLDYNGSYSWSLWDNFKLTYRAKNPDALASVIENYIQRSEALILESEQSIGSNELGNLNSSITSASNVLKSQDGNLMYDELKDLVANYNEAEESRTLYPQLTDLMGEFVNAIEEYGSTASEQAYEDAVNLYDELSEKIDGSDVYDPRSLTNEEVKEAIEKIERAIVNLQIPAEVDQASDNNPIDMTFLIVNPSYEDNTSNGWTGGENHDGYNRKDMVEHWHSAFDHSQTIKGLRAGTYELKVNCFNRIEDDAQKDLNYLEAGEKLAHQTAFVYVLVGDQTFAEPFRNITEGGRQNSWDLSGTYTTSTSKNGTTIYAPNNMTAAGAAFEETIIDDQTGDEIALGDEENYVVRVIFTLEEEGDITIGCKNPATDSWAIWDNWGLTYFGTDSSKTPSGDATLVEEIENNNVIIATEIYTLGGARVAKMQKGINIVKMSDGSFRKVYIK